VIVTVAALEVTVAVSDAFEGSFGATAVMLTAPFGADAGATYTPIRLSVGDAEIVPVAATPPAVPFTSQVTVTAVVLVGSLRFTTAVKSAVPLSPTLAVVGVIVTEVTVTAPPLELPLPPQADNAAMLAIVKIAKKPSRTLFFNREPPLRPLLLFESTNTLLVTVSSPTGMGKVLRLHES
jgi:hypothetical protein